MRGLNARARRDAVRMMVHEERPHIVCIIETKIDSIPQMLIFSMLGMNYADYAFMPAVGTCGGILVAARTPDVHLSDVHVGCFSVSIMVHMGASDHVGGQRPLWWLTIIYGSQGDSKRELFLEELAAVRDACPGPWAVIGDFNLILVEADKGNARINRCNMSGFRQSVAELELIDIHLHGR